MGGDALAAMDDLHRRGGGAPVDALVHERVRDRVVVAGELDVIVDVDAGELPLGVDEGLGGQRVCSATSPTVPVGGRSGGPAHTPPGQLGGHALLRPESPQLLQAAARAGPGLPGRPVDATRGGPSGLAHVGGLKPLRAPGHLELHLVALGQALEALRLDGVEVHEHVLTALLGDEAVALRIVATAGIAYEEDREVRPRVA